MSEALKKLKEEIQITDAKGIAEAKHKYGSGSFRRQDIGMHGTVYGSKSLKLVTYATPEEIEKELQKLKKEVAERKEELFLRREKLLSDIRKIFIHQKEDEETGVILYEELLKKMKDPIFANNPTMKLLIQDIEEVIREERIHRGKLTAGIQFLAGISSRKQETLAFDKDKKLYWK